MSARTSPLSRAAMPHLAMAFAISHPAVSCALLGARTDEIVPPGTDAGTLDQVYVPPAIQKTGLRRRPLSERSAA
jgi:aryl-alcohol dehydrogenase (NADP+)